MGVFYLTVSQLMFCILEIVSDIMIRKTNAIALFRQGVTGSFQRVLPIDTFYVFFDADNQMVAKLRVDLGVFFLGK